MTNKNSKYRILLRSLFAAVLLSIFSLINLFTAGFYEINERRFGIGWPIDFFRFQITGEAGNFQLKPMLALGDLIFDLLFWYAVVYLIEYLFNILRNLGRSKNEKV